MANAQSGAITEFSGALVDRRICALCGSSESEIHIGFRDIPVVRCRKCGFIYSSRVLSEEAASKYYEQNFGSQRHLEGQSVNARTNAVVLEQLLNLKSIKTWLDIGCGYGFLLRWLSDRGIHADGVELSHQEAEHAKAQGLRVHNTFLSQSGLQKNHFDVVSSFEVIEHISAPRAFLAEMAEYVKPGGYLVVMTDNFESAAARKLQAGFPKWIPHSHISHFGPESLRNCIAGIPGLTIEKEAAYTPWDVSGRQLLAHFKSPVPAENAFDLRATLSTEMHKDYKLYRLRYLTNPIWTRLNMTRRMEGGAQMYALCRKRT